MFKKVLAFGFLGIAAASASVALTRNSQNITTQNVYINETRENNGELDITSDAGDSIGKVNLSDELVTSDSYSIRTGVHLNDGYQFDVENDDENYFDVKVNLYDEDGTIIGYDRTNLSENYSTSGWSDGAGGFGFGKDEFPVALIPETNYSWNYEFNALDSEDNKIHATTNKVEFITESGPSDFEPAKVEVLNETSVEVTVTDDSEDLIDLTSIKLTGTGVADDTMLDHENHTIIVEGLTANTTYDDWYLTSGSWNNINDSLQNQHVQKFKLPTFKTPRPATDLEDDLHDSVDSISIQAFDSILHNDTTEYRYSINLNESLTDSIEEVTITTKAQTTSKVLIDDSFTINGSDLILGKVTRSTFIDKTQQNLTTTISVKYKGYAEPITIELDEDSPIASFERSEALDGITTSSKNEPLTKDQKLLISILSFAVASVILLLIAIWTIREGQKLKIKY